MQIFGRQLPLQPTYSLGAATTGSFQMKRIGSGNGTSAAAIKLASKGVAGILAAQ
jgi:hypothetical protein